MAEKISVVFFQRKPLPFHKSVEYIFNDVRRRLPDYVQTKTKVFSVFSKGVLQRMRIMWEAYRNQGDVNHVTGDIHFAAIWLKRSKTILTVLDCGMLSGSRGLKHQLLKYFWFTLPLKKCAEVTVISGATRKELLKYADYPEKNIHVIYVAVSPGYVYVPKTFDRDKPVILQVGTKPNKNVNRLIEAVKDIPCRLNIIGRLPEDVTALLEKYGIDYYNAYDLSEAELIDQYAQCDILSFVSTYEGFGMPIVEANATGRPVITSNLLSMPEVAGNAACLVDPFKVDDIRAGLLKIINNEEYRNELVRNGLENRKRFDPQVIADQYLSLYKKLSGYSASPVYAKHRVHM